MGSYVLFPSWRCTFLLFHMLNFLNRLQVSEQGLCQGVGCHSEHTQTQHKHTHTHTLATTKTGWTNQQGSNYAKPGFSAPLPRAANNHYNKYNTKNEQKIMTIPRKPLLPELHNRAGGLRLVCQVPRQIAKSLLRPGPTHARTNSYIYISYIYTPIHVYIRTYVGLQVAGVTRKHICSWFACFLRSFGRGLGREGNPFH